MAYPPAYTRTFSFTDYEVNFPGEPKPGDKLDTEYDNVANALTATQNSLALIQRADGQLANDSVGPDQIQDDLFDGIADGITDDAQAAADAAAASATAAATSSSQAQSSETNAAASAGTASGAAAQAGVSQGIAQGAATDAAASASDAADSAAAAANSANESQGFRNEAEGFQALAFDWAEQLEGPVMPAPPGWPEAVDDGMFSSKWWAIRARDYNATVTIDLGTAGTDIGEAFDIWDALAGNDLGIGQTYATWGTPVHTYVLIDRSNPSDPTSWLDITGGPGPPNILTIGTVTSGTPSSATITGTSPAQVLNLVIEPGPQGIQGIQGIQGVPGPANNLTMGTTTTGAPGSAADVTITGASPNQTVNFTIPRGDVGPQGIQGPAGNPTFAAPSVLVGLTAVAGSGTNGMRSDAAPALDQAITPVWTGVHQFNSQVRLAGGAAGTPSIVFTGDTDTGIFRPGPDEIRLATGGAGGFGLEPTQVYSLLPHRFVDGTIALPGISFLADPDTGFFRTASDHFAVTSGGIDLVYFMGPGASTLQRTRFIRPVSLADGTAAQPSLMFETDIDTGIFRNGTNRLSIAAGGAEILTVLPDQVTAFAGFRAPAGSVGAPAYTFSADTDTGMYRSTADEGRLVAGGVAAIIWDFGPRIYLRGQVQGPDGTVGAPGYAFENDIDTGLYRNAGNNDARHVYGGAESLWWSGTFAGSFLPFLLADGSAGAPSLSFRNDIDTGLYRPSSDTLGFATGGAVMATFSSSAVSMGVPASAPSFTSTSSRAIKRETGAPKRAASILSRLRPILYRLLEGSDSEQLGLIAEEVRDVCPQLSDGKSVAYDRLAILLLAAWQDEHTEAA